MKSLLVSLSVVLISGLFSTVYGQTNELSVAFSDGFIGTQSSNTNTASNILTFSTLGIRSAAFVQDDTDGNGVFGGGTQGNDLSGTIRLYLNSGSIISLTGALNWRRQEGGNLVLLGFVFDQGQNATITYSGGTYNIVGGNTSNTSSNLGLKKYGTDFTYNDNDLVRGDAATNGLLAALNLELSNQTTFSISLTQASVLENENLIFSITFSSSTTTELVKLFSFSGTSTSGSDYNTNYTFSNGVTNNGDGTISIPSGVSSFTITVSTLNDDLVEGTESVILNLGTQSSTGNILDADAGGFIGSNQTICPNTTPATLTTSTAAISAPSSYQWQSSTDNASFSNVSSGGTSETYTPVSLSSTTYFRRNAVISGTTYTSNSVMITVLGSSSITWTGSSSTSFATSSNWNPSVTSPTGCSVTIPSSSTRVPQLSTNTSLLALTIESGKSIDLSSNNLTLTGNLSNSGSVIGTGNLIFGGSTAQTISGIGSVKNITINNPSGVSISSDTLNVLGVFTPTSGRITTNNRLVFKATSTEEGTIGVYGGSCSGTPTNPFDGEVIVERYIPGNQRAFRFLTPGVTSTTTINANWQEGGLNTGGRNYPYTSVSDQNPKLGYGTHITGNTTGINGLDATITGNPSLYIFNDNQTWSAITNTVTPTFKVGEAYRIMVRGSRAMNLNINDPVPDNTIIRTKGIPAFCDITFNTLNAAPLKLVPNAGVSTIYSFIGNPYWSVVDWHSVSKTGVQNFYYYWDPTAIGTNRRGAFVTVNIDGSGNASDGAGPAQTRRYLQPGQAVLVKSTSANPSITFSESNKNTSNRINVFAKNPVIAGGEIGDLENRRTRGDNSKKSEMIFVSLFLSQNTTNRPADAISLFYNESFTNSVGNDDAGKLSNLDENIAFVADNQKLAFLGMNLSSDFRSDTLPISMWNLYYQNYILRFNLTNNISPDREILLLNRVTGQTTKIPNNSIYEYSFAPQNGVKTNDQFALIFNTRQFIPKPRTRKDLSIFPNPVNSSSLVSIALPLGSLKVNQTNIAKVEVYDVRGRIITAGRIQFLGEESSSFDIGDLPSGSYSIRVTVNGKTHISNIIKQ